MAELGQLCLGVHDFVVEVPFHCVLLRVETGQLIRNIKLELHSLIHVLLESFE